MPWPVGRSGLRWPRSSGRGSSRFQLKRSRRRRARGSPSLSLFLAPSPFFSSGLPGACSPTSPTTTRERYDGVLCNLRMPVMDGIEVHRLLSVTLPAVRGTRPFRRCVELQRGSSPHPEILPHGVEHEIHLLRFQPSRRTSSMRARVPPVGSARRSARRAGFVEVSRSFRGTDVGTIGLLPTAPSARSAREVTSAPAALDPARPPRGPPSTRGSARCLRDVGRAVAIEQLRPRLSA